MNPIKSAAASLLFANVMVCGSCAPDGGASFLSSTTAAANNHIMLVRESPPTFGLRRLAALSARHPDLAVFVASTGTPDFLAETSKGDNRYLILYYLDSRKAFACRTGSGSSRQVEFSGPYPVTDNEFRTLSKLGVTTGR